jgi:hypothetical protein
MWTQAKPLFLFCDATHYDTPCSLCVATVRDTRLRYSPGRFEPGALIDLGGRALSVTSSLSNVIDWRCTLPRLGYAGGACPGSAPSNCSA